MTKEAFLSRLGELLADLPGEEVEERLRFYGEMIDDRMEEGLSQDAAVSAVGNVEQIADQIRLEYMPVLPLPAVQKPPRKWWVILLLILGSPIWASLGIAALVVTLALYVSLWSVIISMWAVFGAFVGCAVYGIVAGIAYACAGNVLPGVALLGAGLTCAGLGILLFYGCKAATSGTVTLTGKVFRAMGKKKEGTVCAN